MHAGAPAAEARATRARTALRAAALVQRANAELRSALAVSQRGVSRLLAACGDVSRRGACSSRPLRAIRWH